MHLNFLNISQFRNFESVSVEFAPGRNLLFGPNGSGKSNLLEAIYYLCTAKSPRGAADESILKTDSDIFRLEGKATIADQVTEIELAYQRHGAKRLKIDGVVQQNLRSLYEQLRAVFSGPDDVDLVYGPPSGRRRFLDISIAQLMSGYISLLWDYRKVTAQRNALLKELGEAYDSLGAVGNEQLLQVWDQKMVELALGIHEYRRQFIHDIGELAAGFHRKITDSSERLEIRYQPSPSLAEHTAAAYHAKLKTRRTRELAMGQSMYGPHRDDVEFVLSGKDCRSTASRGQVKSAVLACKLGILDHMRNLWGEPPILLLDEMYSDLDRKRLDLLVSILGDMGQVIITTSKLAEVKDLSIFKRILKIDAGQATICTF